MAEVDTGNIIKRYNFWNPATWSIPSLYWDVFSDEQRIHAICKELGKVINYLDYLGINTDDIAGRLIAIEEGQLDPYIISEIEQWFEDNEPFIVAQIQQLQDVLPLSAFDENNTVKDALDVIDGDGWVTTARLADQSVTYPKIASSFKVMFFNYHTPEMYGAVGNGVTDDTQAFKDMLDAMPSNSICIIQHAQYKITEPLVITQDNCRFTSFERSNSRPNIYFNIPEHSGGNHCITVYGKGNTFSNINFSQSNRYQDDYMFYFDASQRTYDIDVTIENCIIYNVWNAIGLIGRNAHITNNLFSMVLASSIVILNPASAVEIRGYVIDNNRFHVGGMIVNAANFATYKDVFNLTLVNNFVDFSKRLYMGISDNVNISGNTVMQTALYGDYLIRFNGTVLKNTSCSICNNFIDTQGATNVSAIINGATVTTPGHVGGLIAFAPSFQGLCTINGNTFRTLITIGAHPIISDTGNVDNHLQIINVTGNNFHTSSAVTPIQFLSSNTNCTGIIDGNSVCTANSQYFISYGNLTQGTNYTANVNYYPN